MRSKLALSLLLPLTASLLLMGCTHAAPSLTDALFPLTAEDTPFPAAPTGRYVTRTERNLITRQNTVESSTGEVRSVTTVETLAPGRFKVTVALPLVESKTVRGTEAFVVSGSPALDGLSFSFRYDCATKKLSDRQGFQPALDRVEKYARSREEKHSLTDTLAAIVEQAATLCAPRAGPFNLARVAGKRPGFRWREPLPISGFESTELEAQFLGWQGEGANKLAVLKGEAKAKAKAAFGEREATTELDTVAYFFFSPDHAYSKKITETGITISAPMEPGVRGWVRIEGETRREIKP